MEDATKARLTVHGGLSWRIATGPAEVGNQLPGAQAPLAVAPSTQDRAPGRPGPGTQEHIEASSTSKAQGTSTKPQSASILQTQHDREVWMVAALPVGFQPLRLKTCMAWARFWYTISYITGFRFFKKTIYHSHVHGYSALDRKSSPMGPMKNTLAQTGSLKRRQSLDCSQSHALASPRASPYSSTPATAAFRSTSCSLADAHHRSRSSGSGTSSPPRP